MIKFLRNKFDELYKKVDHKFHPVVESFDTIHFTPNLTTKSGAHIRDAADLKRTMMFVIFAMIPCLLFGIWNAGHQHYIAQDLYAELGDGFWYKIGYGALKVIPIVAVSYIAGLTVEFIFGVIRGHSLHEGFLVSGLLIPLIMPVEVPLWQVAVATVFAVIIGKEVFGGTGMNVVNVALTARAFIFFSYPNSMIGDKVWLGGIDKLSASGELVDGVTGATSLGQLASFSQDQPAYENLQGFYNDHSIWETVSGVELGSIGETSVIAILLGAAFLIWTGVGSWRIMASFFIGGLSLAFLMNVFAGPEDYYMQIDPFHLLFLGGFMFGMVFMATDPVTASQTNTGKYIYGFLAGFLSILIRVLNPAYPEGVMLAILIANVFAPTIDHYVVQANIKKRQKRAKLAASIK